MNEWKEGWDEGKVHITKTTSVATYTVCTKRVSSFSSFFGLFLFLEKITMEMKKSLSTICKNKM